MLLPVVLIGWPLYSFLNGGLRPAWVVAWSADSNILGAGFGGYGKGGGLDLGDQDNTIRLWDINQPEKAPIRLRTHTSRVMGLAFSPNDRWMASGDEWGTTLLWDLQDLQAVPTVLDSNPYPYTGGRALAFSSDSNWLAGGGGAEDMGVWNLTAPSYPFTRLTPTLNYINNVVFFPDNRTIAASADGPIVHFWELGPSGNKSPLFPNVTDVGTIALSADGRILAGADKPGGGVRLWNMFEPKAAPVRLVEPIGLSVSQGDEQNSALYTSLDFSRGGSLLAASIRDDQERGRILVWDLLDLKALPRELKWSGGYSTDLSFSPNGKWLAASSYDGQVRVWDVANLDGDPSTLSK